MCDSLSVKDRCGMKTDQIHVIDEDSVEQLANIIRNGGLAVIPTDTVYGLVCDPFNNEAIDALFAAKQRPRSKSLQILLPSLQAIHRLRLNLPSPLDFLAERLLPGPFSPVCIACDDCQLKTVRQEGSMQTQAVRVPDSVPCQRILGAVGSLAASSANLSGQPSARTVQEAYEQLGDSVELYLDAGSTPGLKPSTVVTADTNQKAGIGILREGAISADSIYSLLFTYDQGQN